MSSENQREVFSFLDSLNIFYEVINHSPVFTIEEMEAVSMPYPGIVKNLFLRDDKKKKYYLVVLPKTKSADMKTLRTKINSRPLSFASEEDLMRLLGLTKGSVTPFGVLHDTSHSVTVVFDEEFFSYDKIGVHPNENTATVWLSFSDLVQVVEKCGNEIIFSDL